MCEQHSSFIKNIQLTHDPTELQTDPVKPNHNAQAIKKNYLMLTKLPQTAVRERRRKEKSVFKSIIFRDSNWLNFNFYMLYKVH